MINIPGVKAWVALIASVKTPLSYAVLALLLIASLCFYLEERLIGILVLSLNTIIVLLILPRVQGQTQSESDSTIKWYRNIHDLFPDMTNLIESSIATENTSTIEVMGLTLFEMWRYLQNFIPLETTKDMDVTLTTIAGTEQQISCMKTNWSELSQATCKNIDAYVYANREELDRRNIKISVHKYDHIPMFHGILIDGKHLFFSFTSWSNEGLSEGAETFYCYYNTSTPIGKSHLRIFRSWFDHTKNNYPC